MNFRVKNGIRSLLLPGSLILGAAAVLIQSGTLEGSGAAVNFCYYAAFATGLLLAWRFHSSRIFSALIVLVLGQHALEFFSSGRTPMTGPGLTALEAISFLVPLNLLLLALTRERGFSFQAAVPRLVILFLESVFVAVLCRPQPSAGSRLFHRALLNRHWFAWTQIPQISLVVLVAVAAGLLVRALGHRKPLESGFIWALLSFFLALNIGGVGVGARAYIATAAIILVVSIIETSYAMAYHDELTGLPSRRAFNEAALKLEPPYTVATVDVDHFKSVNDTYGHDTGDDVLCLVASKLSQVTGGGLAYRVGGEEFSILFPGKTSRDVLPDLESLRAQIEQSPFRLRGTDRRNAARGSDRRNASQSKSTRSRKKPQRPTSGELKVTASIGVGEPSSKHPTLEEVINLADKALYRAKQAGRNRIEVGVATRARGKKKSAENIA